MDPILLASLIGAGTGTTKSLLVDIPRAEHEKKARAAEQQFSPWTHMQPTTQVHYADPLGSAMQGGVAGAQFGQGLETQAQNKQYSQDVHNWMQRGGGPVGTISTALPPPPTRVNSGPYQTMNYGAGTSTYSPFVDYGRPNYNKPDYITGSY